MPSAGESSLLSAVSSWTVGSGVVPERWRTSAAEPEYHLDELTPPLLSYLRRPASLPLCRTRRRPIAVRLRFRGYARVP
jgi:hypothetical protein